MFNPGLFYGIRSGWFVVRQSFHLSFQCSSVGTPLGMHSHAPAWERGGGLNECNRSVPPYAFDKLRLRIVA